MQSCLVTLNVSPQGAFFMPVQEGKLPHILKVVGEQLSVSPLICLAHWLIVYRERNVFLVVRKGLCICIGTPIGENILCGSAVSDIYSIVIPSYSYHVRSMESNVMSRHTLSGQSVCSAPAITSLC